MPPEEIQQPSTETSSTETTSNAGTGSTPDVAKLLKALESERTARQQLEVDLRSRTNKEREFEQALEKYKSIDPDRYEKLLQADREREEQDLIRKKSFDELKDRYRQETETSKKQEREWQSRYETLTIETAVKTAFFDNGGRKSGYDPEFEGIEDVAPVEAILSTLRNRLKLEEGKVLVTDRSGNLELNNEGRPKTLGEKMGELRKGSMGALFEPESDGRGGGMTTITGSNGKTVKLFSKEQARNGKASIDDIASGKAYIQ